MTASKPKRRIMSIALFVLAVLLVVLGLAFAAAADRLSYLLLAAALVVSSIIFYRRGK